MFSGTGAMRRVAAINMKYLGTDFTNFRDYDFGDDGNHNFQWTDVKTFEVASADAADGDIIAAIIGSIEYRDDYVGGGIDPEGVRHGPYWISGISVNSYERISVEAAEDIFLRWLRKCGSTPAPLASELDRSVGVPIKRSDAIYALKKLDETAINDYGNLHMEFHELIAIDKERGEVFVIVLTDD